MLLWLSSFEIINKLGPFWARMFNLWTLPLVMAPFLGLTPSIGLAQGAPILVEVSGNYATADGELRGVFLISKFGKGGPVDYSDLNTGIGVEKAFRPGNEVTFIYDLFEKEAVKRPALAIRPRAVLQEEDARLGEMNRTVGFRLSTLGGETSAYFQLYDGNRRSDGSDHRIPAQMSNPEAQLKYADTDIPIFEVKRLGKDIRNADFDIGFVAKMMAFHLIHAGFKEFILYAHTDAAGARLYTHYGFEIELGPEQLGKPNEFILSIKGSNFLGRYFPNDFLTHSRRPPRRMCRSLSS